MSELNDREINLLAKKTMKPLTEIKPDEDFRNELKYRFMEKAKSAQAKKPAKEYTARGFFVFPGFRRSLAVVTAILVLTAGMAFASTNAMPDSPLYGVKKAFEHIDKTMSISREAKTEKILNHNSRRIDEIKYLKKKNAKKIEELLLEIEQNTKELNSALKDIPLDRRQNLENKIDKFIGEKNKLTDKIGKSENSEYKKESAPAPSDKKPGDLSSQGDQQDDQYKRELQNPTIPETELPELPKPSIPESSGR